MKTELKEYIQNWRTHDLKPCNDIVFIDGFIWLLNNIDEDNDIEFNGDGSYFGKKVTIDIDSYYGRADFDLSFEVAYSGEKISVYTSNHNGFWNPEYLVMTPKDERFKDLKDALINRLTKVFGL